MVGRSEFVLFSGVVVDHVENHLDARSRETSEPSRGTRCVGVVAGRVAVVERAPGERHVAPVVALVGIELVHRQQLDGGDAERAEVGHEVGKPGERAAQFGRHERRTDRGPAHMHLIDDQVVVVVTRTRRRRRRCNGDGQHRRTATAPSVAAPCDSGPIAIVVRREPHRSSASGSTSSLAGSNRPALAGPSTRNPYRSASPTSPARE